ncbi:hypothetical protein ACGFZJ_13565 [Streptomyces sp. NPDC048253]
MARVPQGTADETARIFALQEKAEQLKAALAFQPPGLRSEVPLDPLE